MKKAKNLISLLLISLLVFSTIQLISGNFVSASTGAANFLPNNFTRHCVIHAELCRPRDRRLRSLRLR